MIDAWQPTGAEWEIEAIVYFNNAAGADEQGAYSMTYEDEECPAEKSMPNNPRRSLDGLFGLCTGTNFFYELYTLTQAEASKLMQSDNWASKEET